MRRRADAFSNVIGTRPDRSAQSNHCALYVRWSKGPDVDRREQGFSARQRALFAERHARCRRGMFSHLSNQGRALQTPARIKRRINGALINLRLGRFRVCVGRRSKSLGDAKRFEHRTPHREEQVFPKNIFVRYGLSFSSKQNTPKKSG